MSNITLSLPQELKSEMDKLPELNWSEIIRQFLSDKVRRAQLLKKLDKALENSRLSEEDCLRLGEIAKEGMSKRYKARGW